MQHVPPVQNFSRLSGPYDTWNLDYIYLNKRMHDKILAVDDQLYILGGRNFTKEYILPDNVGRFDVELYIESTFLKTDDYKLAKYMLGTISAKNNVC